ncbi:MAG: LptF/LptG family permease [Planctomycetes bacterium]|nr:LptF/LptG family permease [Planctomycetota bacterium]
MELKIFNSLQKYVLGELLVSTVGAIITINLLAFVVSALVFVRKFPVMGASFFIYSAPPLIYLVLPYTLSLGLLVGVTLTFGQIANQREEVIMQFNGISFGIFIKPVFFVSLLGIIAVFFSTHYLQPVGFRAEDNRQFDVLTESLQNLPSGANAFSFKTFSLAYEERKELENAKKDEFWFEGLTLLFTNNQKVTQLISAKNGQLSFSKNQYEIYFDLKDCFIIFFKEPFEKLPQTIFQKNLSISRKFAHLSADVETEEKKSGNIMLRLTPHNPKVSQHKGRTKTMNTFHFIDELKIYKQELSDKESKFSSLEKDYWTKKDELIMMLNSETPSEEKPEEDASAGTYIPGNEIDEENSTTDSTNEAFVKKIENELELMEKEIEELKEEIHFNKRSYARNQAELFRRFGMSIAPLSFILLGFPLGLLLRQGNKLVVFSLSLLIIGVVYYPVEQYFVRLTQQQLTHPLTVTIIPNLARLFVAFVISRLLLAR